MASYKFRDSDNLVMLIEPGDYVLEVVGYELKLSTKGDPQIEVDVVNVDPKTLDRIPGKSTKFKDTLTLSEKAGWRVDTFLKSCGIQIAKDAEVEFDPEQRDDGKVFVDLRGLRGWALVGQEPGTKDPTKKFQKVVTWYTNKEKIARRPYPSLPEPGAVVQEVGADGKVIPF